MNLDIAQIANGSGIVVLVLAFVMALIKGYFVTGQSYSDMKSDRDDWKHIALTGADAANRALDVAEANRRQRRAP